MQYVVNTGWLKEKEIWENIMLEVSVDFHSDGIQEMLELRK